MLLIGKAVATARISTLVGGPPGLLEEVALPRACWPPGAAVVYFIKEKDAVVIFEPNGRNPNENTVQSGSRGTRDLKRHPD